MKVKLFFFINFLVLISVYAKAQLIPAWKLYPTVFYTELNFKTNLVGDTKSYDHAKEHMKFKLGRDFQNVEITYQEKTFHYDVDFIYVQYFDADRQVETVRIMLKGAPYDVILGYMPFPAIMLHYRYQKNEYAHSFLIQSEQEDRLKKTLDRLRVESKYVFVDKDLYPICRSCFGRGFYTVGNILTGTDDTFTCEKCDGKGYIDK